MALRETNLIPPEILLHRHQIRHLFFWKGCLILLLALIFGINIYAKQGLLTEEHTLTKLKNMHTRLGANVDKIQRLQKKLDNLKQKAVFNIIAKQKPYYRVLLKLAELMNEKTWLTKLAIERGKDEEAEAEGRQVDLIGFSQSNADLGGFYSQLSIEPMFKAVVLNYAKEVEMARSRNITNVPLRLTKFRITCRI
jgi:Tfp pilus assembly protein PilN